MTYKRCKKQGSKTNTWDPGLAEKGSVMVPRINKGANGPSVPTKRKYREKDTEARQQVRDREDRCRKAFIKGATKMPRELLEYQSELCGERTRPQKNDKNDLIRKCCEEARSRDRKGDTDRTRWFEQQQMLETAGRSYKRYLVSQGTTDFNQVTTPNSTSWVF